MNNWEKVDRILEEQGLNQKDAFRSVHKRKCFNGFLHISKCRGDLNNMLVRYSGHGLNNRLVLYVIYKSRYYSIYVYTKLVELPELIFFVTTFEKENGKLVFL